jgi:hypothetical protein
VGVLVSIEGTIVGSVVGDFDGTSDGEFVVFVEGFEKG